MVYSCMSLTIFLTRRGNSLRVNSSESSAYNRASRIGRVDRGRMRLFLFMLFPDFGPVESAFGNVEIFSGIVDSDTSAPKTHCCHTVEA